MENARYVMNDDTDGFKNQIKIRNTSRKTEYDLKLMTNYFASIYAWYDIIASYPISSYGFWKWPALILSTKAERYVVYSSNFERTFEACFSNRHDLNTELNNLLAKVLLLHFVSKKKNECSCV